MADILDEASALLQCKECPWYKCCVTPMRMNPEDIRRQFLSRMPGAFGASPMGDDSLIRLLGEMAATAQNMLLEGCPIFIERLRANPRLSDRIKKLMQGWGMEDEQNSPDRTGP